MKYTTAESKQIANRFDAMYQLLTKKTWIKGDEALNKEGEATDPTDRDAKQFCLIGAVKHINGPTEEEITKLTALQILIDDDRLSEGLVSALEFAGLDSELDTPMDRVRAIEAFFDPNFDTIDIITNWNDNDARTLGEVKSMLKRAAKLYDKLMPAGLALRQIAMAEEMAKKLKV